MGRDSGNVGRDSGNVGCDSGNVSDDSVNNWCRLVGFIPASAGYACGIGTQSARGARPE